MSVADSITSFASPYTVTRASAADTYSGGRRVTGATTTVSVDAVVVPVTGQEVQQLPPGLHTQEVKAVFTTSQLFCAADMAGTDKAADKISIDSETYQVRHVEKWNALGATYYRALVTRVL
jgi:hypothetical protein